MVRITTVDKTKGNKTSGGTAMARLIKRDGIVRPQVGLLLIVCVLAAGAAFWWWDYDPIDRTYGKFEGRVTGTWDDDGRNMQLVEDFSFVDPRGKRWQAPTGSMINGASIPRVFWSVIGGPFEGRFRNASVVHDAACEAQKEPWQEVHRMFYNAMRCSRVGEGKAQTMFWAVYQFGPRWPMPGDEQTVFPFIAEPDEEVVKKAQRYFDRKQFTTTEIEECSVEQIEAEVDKWDAAARAP
jgi:hypothetical protein